MKEKIKAKKSLGQNFLRSKEALDAIIDAADPRVDEIVLEIGPGEGVLTERLLKLAGKVVAVEKDHRLIPLLKEKFQNEIKNGHLDIIEKDVLDFDENLLNFYKEPYSIVANIPYYITGQLLRKFLEAKNQPESMILLLQKEVAERIVAKDGKESLLSISVKAFSIPEYIKTVGKGSFSPQPKVDSAIISIQDINRKRFTEAALSDSKKLENKFFEILRAGFAHKRKLLMKNLGVSKPVFDTCKIPEKARAEDLKVEDWICLTKNI
jgi:16S rRNA (adenine1518-N6/adenine1519-N6)-dimethyltransferase